MVEDNYSVIRLNQLVKDEEGKKERDNLVASFAREGYACRTNIGNIIEDEPSKVKYRKVELTLTRPMPKVVLEKLISYPFSLA